MPLLQINFFCEKITYKTAHVLIVKLSHRLYKYINNSLKTKVLEIYFLSFHLLLECLFLIIFLHYNIVCKNILKLIFVF